MLLLRGLLHYQIPGKKGGNIKFTLVTVSIHSSYYLKKCNERREKEREKFEGQSSKGKVGERESHVRLR